jgi:polyphosphate glucokinase
MQILGIDIGGSGIKGAPVEIETGTLLAMRQRIPTPEPSKPKAVAQAVADLVKSFAWAGLIGCGYPSVVRNGVVMAQSNMHPKWVGVDAAALFKSATGCQVCVVNDADAAGLAEMTYGAGRRVMGVVMLVTIGTGLGSALFCDGILVPNTELGHLQMNGMDAEWQASDAARKRENLSWKAWSKHFNQYMIMLEDLFWPDLFILGGGSSGKFETFSGYLKLHTPVVPAQFLNEAGIVGAALSALPCLQAQSNE